MILVGTEFWGGLVAWIKETLLANGTISPEDLSLFHVTDDLDEVVRIITGFYADRSIRPNF